MPQPFEHGDQLVQEQLSDIPSFISEYYILKKLLY